MTGRALAERWCASCHIIDRAPATATANGQHNTDVKIRT
jgi:mono/diheme cytochrome c family protein